MIQRLDIAERHFDCIDFDHCTLYVAAPWDLGNRLEVVASELVIHQEPSERYRPLRETTGSEENILIAEYSRLIFDDLMSVEILVTLYDPVRPSEFLLGINSQPVQLVREWRREAREKCYEYLLGGALDWPPGDCQLTIRARGGASLEYDANACIPMSRVEGDLRRYRLERRQR